MEKMYIITFNSTHHAIMFEKILKELNLRVRTIPTPREISSSCGLSITFEEIELDKVKQKLDEHNINYYGVFKVNKSDDGKKEVSKIY